MLFNTLEYLLFLPLVALLHFALPHRFRWALLLLASYFFYAYWRADFLLLVLASTVIDYLIARRMNGLLLQQKRKPWLYASLLFNLGLLISFKYLGFFNESLHEAMVSIGWDYQKPVLDLILPVGISFYTFQTLSYTIDVYKGRRKAERHFGYFSLYVSFFPQLVAGPIERSDKLLPQLQKARSFKMDQAFEGFRLILWGLFKKILIADTLSIFVGEVYGDLDAFGGNMYALASAAFMIQIYADFSGYSDMAIGSAKVLGIELSTNFNRPFFSRSVAEVWRRWHITLYDWLRDYVYIPMGGNRVSKWRWRLNVMIVFVAIGVWHGAAWGFFWFGCFHALMVLFSDASKQPRNLIRKRIGIDRLPVLAKLWDMGLTFVLWTLAVIVFRADSMAEAWQVYSNLLSGGGLLRYQYVLQDFTETHFWVLVCSLTVLFLSEWINRDPRLPFGSIRLRPVRWALYLGLLFAMLIFEPRTREAFLYFQF